MPGSSIMRACDCFSVAADSALTDFSVLTSRSSRTARYLTVSPGRIRAGSSRFTSHSGAFVCPISCQPPGERCGYTAENRPARATDPAGTAVRGESLRGTSSGSPGATRYANPGAKPPNAAVHSAPV